jgi:hypothetical protein
MKHAGRLSSLLLVVFLSACGSSGGNESPDSDGDGVIDSQDAFPQNRSESKDSDGDGVGDNTDNCLITANLDQLDTDQDLQGDVCDADMDNDTVLNEADNCPVVANVNQLNTDADALGDACDTDIDNDTLLNEVDNCPLNVNTNQLNTDADSFGDVCDADIDNDTVLNEADNCPLNVNPNQLNTDADSFGDVCDADIDNDTVLNEADNCPLNVNTNQLNTDADSFGDVCDTDIDNDRVLNEADNCPVVANTNQLNTDADAQGDVCDNDSDNDSILNTVDNCPLIANSNQLNTDANFTNGDALGDACDNDDDADGVLDGDDAFPINKDETKDTDSDGVGDNTDNCVSVANASQLNTDANFTSSDTLGNACDPNDDGDAELDGTDPFPLDPTEWQDVDSDEIGDKKDLNVGDRNVNAAQLIRFKDTNRATLFIGPQTTPISTAIADLVVVNVGDVNGDNLDDLAIGVGEESNRDGKVYLFFGSTTPWPKIIDLANITESVEYIAFLGQPSGNFANLFGTSISAIGDVNGDELDDFIMSGPGYILPGTTSYSGEAYLVFGRESWLVDAGDDHMITMGELKSQYAITYQGQQRLGLLGEEVSSVGDVNRDGFNDFLITELGYSAVADRLNATGGIHLIFGGTHLQPPLTETSGILNVDTLPVSERTIIITDRLASDPDRLVLRDTLIGNVILGLGNFDNDVNNYDDIAITSTARNKVYVLFGQQTWPALINLPTIEAGKGFVFNAPTASPNIGIGQHIAAGDLNGDNIPELIIAQTNSTDVNIPNKQGDVVILKGGVGNWPANLSLDELTGDVLDFFAAIWSTSEKLALGSGLAVLPDNNNDGLAELLINAPNLNDQGEGQGEGLVFKVTGHANLNAKELNSTTLDAGIEIISSLNTEIAGANLRTLGDHNGDGINEFVIDIPEADATPDGDDTVRTDNGLFYVVQGYRSLYPE